MQVCRSILRTCAIGFQLSIVTSLDVNALNAIPIILLPHGGVCEEEISIAGPGHLITPACKIASHQICGAVLQHVNLAGITTTFPMVWAHPKRGCTCAFAIDHLNIEIELIQIIHAERTFHF
jgi:hypothetical protein